ncbi:MAG: VWA domain-containing protein [Parachlamydiales bacterium]|nr:VWA domain-containing protein [Verrucomicrobiota bacterium]MBX3718175.1 VWA domain-containing protein [Candidatus Acheromyda pituitae]
MSVMRFNVSTAIESGQGSLSTAAVLDSNRQLDVYSEGSRLCQTVDVYTGERVYQIVEKPLGFIIGEQLRIFVDFIYSKLPSFSFPSAAAASVDPHLSAFSCDGEDQVSALTDDPCQVPLGSYVGSCHNRTITYTPDIEECHLEVFCSTVIPSIPPIKNSITYKPDDRLSLGNRNGTLIIEANSKMDPITPEKANKVLDRHLLLLEAIEEELNSPVLDELARKELESRREKLYEKQNEIIGRLIPGSIVTFDDKKPLVITPENKESHKSYYSEGAITSFQKLAESTNGIMGLSRSADHLPYIVEKLFQHIVSNVGIKEGVDIVFVLDTTSSMSDDIALVKDNLLTMLQKLKLDIEKVRVGLIQYRDAGDLFLNRLVCELTTDLEKVGLAIKGIEVNGGGDLPEAVYDAFLAAKEQFSWDPNRKHVAMLIGDAPPHPKTIDKLYAEEDIVLEYRRKEIEIAIYPILTKA